MSEDGKNNVVHLGTGDMAAIGKVLRDMYEFYLYSKPPERLERLVAMIGQAGEGKPPQTGEGKPPEPQEPDEQAAQPDITQP